MTPFRPLPLLGNPHLQTVLGHVLAGARLTFPSRPARVALADGDALAIHDTTPRHWHRGGPVAVLVHGLGGCHDSPYVRRVTQQLALGAARVIRVDLRGCGAGARLARRFFCAACSDDLRAVLEYVHARLPDSPLLLAGFSLGGGIVLKLAGEAADRPVAGLCAVASVAAPLDLVRCSTMLERLPFYDTFFVRNLVRQVRELECRVPDLTPVRFPRRLTVRQFDDLYTAPRWGFAGVRDYYEKASALPWVGRIRVPAFLLTARDDPFIAVESFEDLAPSNHVERHIAPRGGHLGFLGSDGRGGLRWAERQVADWLLARAAQVVSRAGGGDNEADPHPSAPQTAP